MLQSICLIRKTHNIRSVFLIKLSNRTGKVEVHLHAQTLWPHAGVVVVVHVDVVSLRL
jgi:hypothetical protein